MQTVQPIRDKAKIEAMKKILRASTLRNELLFVLGINTGLRISTGCRHYRTIGTHSWRKTFRYFAYKQG